MNTSDAAPAAQFPLLFALDTNVHQGWQFNYDHDVPARLAVLAGEGKVRHVTTSIIEREVKAHMTSGVEVAATASKRFRREASALSSLQEYQVLFKRPDKAAITTRLHQAYDAFAADLETELVGLEGSSLEAVFNDYFTAAAPFEPSKKSEFPDAFHVRALGQWAQNKGRSIYVVSGDGGMRSACAAFPLLVPIERSEQFLEIVATHVKVAEIRQAHEWLAAHGALVQRAIAEHFEGLGFLLVEEGDVNEVRVTRIELGDLSVTSADDGIAEVSVLATIVFEADVSYEDPNTGIYDSEEGVMWGQDTVERTIEQSTQEPVTFEIQYDEPPESVQDVLVVRVNDDKDLILEATDA